jgi:NAD(P) transhydrogenase
MSSAFDVVVIGSGPAGEKAAMQAAKARRRVAVVERLHQLGGNCLHTGTIPSKTLRETTLYLAGARQRSLTGVQTRLDKNVKLAVLMQRAGEVVRGQTAVLERKLERNDVALFTGNARFLDPHRIEVVEQDGGRREITGDRIVIATGSRPARDPAIPFDDDAVYDSDTMLRLDILPRTLTIVGAGVIGCEYACMFAVLGTKVTLVDSRPRVLEVIDREIAEMLVARMRDQGILMRLGEEVATVRRESADRVVATTRSGKVMASQKLLYAVGREGNTADLELARAGLAAGRHGLLSVNANFQTAVPHVYAVGDVIGFPSLAATAMHQGRVAMAHALGLPVNGEGHALPYGVYTIPELSMVGETEEQLTNAGVPYEIGHCFFREIARGEIVGDRSGMLKLLFERESHRLRGVHIIGEKASELVHIGQAVLAFGGPVDYFVDTVFNFPTLSEAYKVAALNGLNRL